MLLFHISLELVLLFLSYNLCLLIGVFRSFTFNAIIGMLSLSFCSHFLLFFLWFPFLCLLVGYMNIFYNSVLTHYMQCLKHLFTQHFQWSLQPLHRVCIIVYWYQQFNSSRESWRPHLPLWPLTVFHLNTVLNTSVNTLRTIPVSLFLLQEPNTIRII